MGTMDNDDPRAGELADLGDPEVGGLPYPAGKLIEQPDPRLPQRPVSPVTLPPALALPPLATEHHANRTFGDRPDVDPQAQALVWGLTASEHAAEALTALTARRDLAERHIGRQLATDTADELSRLARLHTYHEEAHRIADKCAGTWALVASVQPFQEDQAEDLGMLLDQDELGDSGKRETDA